MSEKSAEASRRNGRRGRGPTSAEGRRRASQNARTHSLRATTVPLPHEDRAAVAGIADAWHEYYRPESPAAVHQANECARGQLLADRADAYLQATLHRQATEAGKAWDHRRNRHVAEQRRKLERDARSGLAGLMRTALGVRWVIAQWLWLADTVAERGYLEPEELEDATRLVGADPEPEAIRANDVAYMLHLHNLAATPGASAAAIEVMLRPANRPDAIRDEPREEIYVDREDSRGMLAATIECELKHLREDEARLGAWDAAERRRAQDEASLPDDAAMRRYLRCHAEARVSFNRSEKGLVAALERDDAEAEARGPEAPATETTVVLATPGAVAEGDAPGSTADVGPSVVPNEPGAAAVGSSQIIEETGVSGDVAVPQAEGRFVVATSPPVRPVGPSPVAPVAAVVVAVATRCPDGASPGAKEGGSRLPNEPGAGARILPQVAGMTRVSGDAVLPSSAGRPGVAGPSAGRPDDVTTRPLWSGPPGPPPAAATPGPWCGPGARGGST